MKGMDGENVVSEFEKWCDEMEDECPVICLHVLALLKQEAKTGHWIDSAGDDKCSVCGAMYDDLYPDYHNTHYCPNCGAKMIGQAVKW